MPPVKSHNCTKEGELGSIKQKQLDRDKQMEKFEILVTRIESSVSIFVEKVSDKYVTKEIFVIHEKKTEEIKKEIGLLKKFRDSIYIKMAFIQGGVSLGLFIGIEKLKSLL